MTLSAAQIKEAFTLFDADSSGAIDVAELTLALKGLGMNLPASEVDELVKSIDKDSNSLIEYEEFEKIVRQRVLQRDSDEEVLQAFKLFDLDKSGMPPPPPPSLIVHVFFCKPTKQTTNQKNNNHANTGYITVQNMLEVTKLIGETTGEDVLKEFIKEAGTSGKVSLQQWKTVMSAMKGK